MAEVGGQAKGRYATSGGCVEWAAAVAAKGKPDLGRSPQFFLQQGAGVYTFSTDAFVQAKQRRSRDKNLVHGAKVQPVKDLLKERRVSVQSELFNLLPATLDLSSSDREISHGTKHRDKQNPLSRQRDRLPRGESDDSVRTLRMDRQRVQDHLETATSTGPVD